MKYQMSVMRKNVQAGFTLIELIVVIVILGILAATALPKFAGLGADARLASLHAAKGALAATVGMAHAQYVANATGTALTVYTAEGLTAPFGLVVAATTFPGYPTASVAFAAIAGLSTADYKILVGPSAATTFQPLLNDGDVAFIPNSVVGTAQGLTCYVKYTQAVDSTPASGSGTTGATPGTPGIVADIILLPASTAASAPLTANPC